MSDMWEKWGQGGSLGGLDAGFCGESHYNGI